VIKTIGLDLSLAGTACAEGTTSSPPKKLLTRYWLAAATLATSNIETMKIEPTARLFLIPELTAEKAKRQGSSRNM
jgi:hypothetical protein